MNQEDRKKLAAATAQVAKLLNDKKEIDDDIAEIVATTAENLGIRKGNIRKAAKELNMDDLERADRRLQEEEMDQIRSALGILADTPLGDAAVNAATEKPARKPRGQRRSNVDMEAAAPAGNA